MRLDRLRGAGIALSMLVALAPLGCLDEGASSQAICVLIDVSGTYADEKDEVVKVIKREVLPNMIPGDTLITILIDSASYEKDNLETLATRDPRPSRANAQKLALAQQLDAFARGDTRSRYTDIPGAMMLAAEYLQEAESGSRVMLVFSDLQEDLPEGARRNMREDEFAGIQVVAMNVKRLERDTVDPDVFRRRLEGWRARVEHAGGKGWRTVMDPSKLPGLLEQMRS
ncbi:MAG: VWA domain-containing protein [Deltaproteobacteria bacterium]|nr:VWA domain-containing protein [Deltaproteobacteria bacterium]